MNVLNGNINNAKSCANTKSSGVLDCDVCIEVNPEDFRLILKYDSGVRQHIKLSDEQRLHLIKSLTKEL